MKKFIELIDENGISQEYEIIVEFGYKDQEYIVVLLEQEDEGLLLKIEADEYVVVVDEAEFEEISQVYEGIMEGTWSSDEIQYD